MAVPSDRHHLLDRALTELEAGRTSVDLLPQLRAALTAALRDGVDLAPLLYRIDLDESAVDSVYAASVASAASPATSGHEYELEVAAGLATLIWERTLQKLRSRGLPLE